ncbi:hypothetical protein ZWY2020_040456 [Hordeum vulgare]|nr:hypothetical protein ZWY2020_040456 [Hordeum vulgare]
MPYPFPSFTTGHMCAARRLPPDAQMRLTFPANLRHSLRPPLPARYFGNGIILLGAACKVRDVVAAGWTTSCWLGMPVYDADFGWGKPLVMQRAVQQRAGLVYLADNGGDGGVRVLVSEPAPVVEELRRLPEPVCCAPGDADRSTHQHQVVVEMDELENMCEEQQGAVSSGGVSVRADCDEQEAEDSREGTEEEDGNGTTEIREEGVLPPKTGSNLHRDSRMSIADVLQFTMEDELIAARESGLLAGGAGTSRRCRGENSSNGWGRNRRALQDDTVPPMKRLSGGGRSCFSSKSGRESSIRTIHCEVASRDDPGQVSVPFLRMTGRQ